MIKGTLLLLIVAVTALVGGTVGRQAPPILCPPALPRGQALFYQASIRSTPGCGTCHSLEAGKVVVGPSLAGIATRADAIITSPGYPGAATSDEQFLRESITRPGAARGRLLARRHA